MTENEVKNAIKTINARLENALQKEKETEGTRNTIIWYSVANDYRCAIKALEEIQQYRAIGTVGECLEAVKKQKPEKPLNKTNVKTFNGKAFAVTGTCPVCNSKLVLSTLKYCYICGQAIDGSVADETSV